MKRVLNCCLVGCAAVLVAFAAAIYAVYAPRLSPSVLAVRVEPANWSRVTFESSNLSERIVVRECCGTAELSDIEHGEYGVAIRFRDGKVLWLSFFHSDAGVRRRVDIDVRRTGETASVRYVTTERPSLFTTRRHVTNRAVRLRDTSQEKPLVLDTI